MFANILVSAKVTSVGGFAVAVNFVVNARLGRLFPEGCINLHHLAAIGAAIALKCSI